MPYIKENEREKFEWVLGEIEACLLNEDGSFDEGELNYLVSKVIWNLFDAKPKYSTANKIVGALQCIQNEFVRRKVNPYEAEKVKDNGDL